MRFTLARLILFVVFFGAEYSAHALPDSLSTMLAKHMRFTQKDLNAVRRGDLVSKAIHTGVKQEVAFLGITYVNAPSSLLVERFRDIETFKTGEAVLKVIKISDPPTKDSFKQMTLEKNDLLELKKCKPGKCDMKLSVRMIEQIHSGVNWADKNHNTSATKLFQDLILQYVQAYLAQGNSALIKYHDQKKPVLLSNEFKEIVDGSPYLRERLPEFYQYLKNYPQEPLQNVEDFVYWSKETLKFRPVITMTHVSMYRPNGREAIFASKQIYANHYMTGSLALTWLISENDDPDKPGFYLMYINRSRSDMLGGLLGGLKRSLTRSRSTAALEENILLIKQRLEKEYAESK